MRRLSRGGNGSGEPPVPGRVEQLVEEADDRLEDDDPDAALRRLDEAVGLLGRADGAPEHRPLGAAVHTLRATALNDLERFAEAEAAAALACELDADEVAAWYERAVAAYRQAGFAEAERCHREALRREPEDAAAWHGLGRALRWQERTPEAMQALRRAAELEPEHFAAPVRIPSAEFDRIAAEVYAGIPPAFRARLRNTLIVVDDLPDADDVADGFDPDTLGIYEGATALEEAGPERIVLYQANHEIVAGSLGGLGEEIRRTVLHEVGHHFGMQEGELPW